MATRGAKLGYVLFREKTRPTHQPIATPRDKIRPANLHSCAHRDKTRPTNPSPGIHREKTRPARQNSPVLAHFWHAGRKISRLQRAHSPQGEFSRAVGATPCFDETNGAFAQPR
ncbi:hypothetical protein HMPREF1522_0604 [Actinomyces sp. ICM54]|nr:hypothetical protein HMPREF1522_0604 [Actinomyces sp. ICM54]